MEWTVRHVRYDLCEELKIRAARDVVPDVVENEAEIEKGDPDIEKSLAPIPGIARLETSSSAKLLTIAHDEKALRGYRCFLAITDKAKKEFGEFFLQPHTTSVVWGGKRQSLYFSTTRDGSGCITT